MILAAVISVVVTAAVLGITKVAIDRWHPLYEVPETAIGVHVTVRPLGRTVPQLRVAPDFPEPCAVWDDAADMIRSLGADVAGVNPEAPGRHRKAPHTLR